MNKQKCQFCDTNMSVGAMSQSRSGWRCKSEIACFNRLLVRQHKLKQAGGVLANLCNRVAKDYNADGQKELYSALIGWKEAQHG